MNQDNGGIIGKLNTPTTTVASGVWTLQDQFEAQTSSIWPLAFPQTTIANSCRFESGNSDYLDKTFSSASDENKIFTVSTWVKKSKLGAVDSHQALISAYRSSDGLQTDVVRFPDDDTFQFYAHTTNSGTNAQLKTNRLFRDVSAWYHIVVRVDTTQSTASNRVRIYVNGTQETSFATETYPGQNGTVVWGLGSGVSHQIGAVGNSHHYSGYLAETIYVDNQSLDATSFGAFNPVTNIWEPRAYAGTYGTNGFRLDFANSSALGNDVSGNDNDFTANNLTSVDQSTDTCSNNFAVLNSSVLLTDVTLSEGNLKAAFGSASTRSPAGATLAPTSGKWYYELKLIASSSGNYISAGYADIYANGTQLGNYTTAGSLGFGINAWDGSIVNRTTTTTASPGNFAITPGDILGVYLDIDNLQQTFTLNGTQHSAGYDAITASTTGFYIPTIGDGGGSATVSAEISFGSPTFAISSSNTDANGYGNFEYSPTIGGVNFYALNTKNLAEFG